MEPAEGVPWPTTIWKLACPTRLHESETCRVNEYAPAVVGVPAMAEVA